MDERLHYVSLDMTAARNIRNIRHSIFGSTPIEFERFPEIEQVATSTRPNS
jgi:hypothetical protein